MTSKPALIVKWNASQHFETETIAAHARVLEQTRTHVWWGKLSKSGKSGLPKVDLKRIKEALSESSEVHLYLYCPDKAAPTLHVAWLVGLQTDKPKDLDAIPYYYSTLAYPVSHWFKLRDIRALSLEHGQQLRTSDGNIFDPVSSNQYPMLILEQNLDALFDYEETNGRPWYQLQQLHVPGVSAVEINTNLVFVLMPFDDEFADIYKFGIKTLVEEHGFECRRADEIFHSRQIMEKVRENIRLARLLIADMSRRNPNVFYELGYAHAFGKQVILITQDRSQVPFDLGGIQNIEYGTSIDKLRSELSKMLRAITAAEAAK